MMDSSFIKKEPESSTELDDDLFTEEYIKVSWVF